MSPAVTTSLALATTGLGTRRRGSSGLIDDLVERFPPRETAQSWAVTELPRSAMERLVCSSPLFEGLDDRARSDRLAGMGAVVDWLAAQPGVSWQQRWQASGAQREPRADWRRLVTAGAGGPRRVEDHLGSGLR